MHLLNRRGFLKQAAVAGLAAGPLASRSLEAAPAAKAGQKRVDPVVGSQLYGWGQYYEREGKDLWAHLDEALSALRDAGFHYAEGPLDAAKPENNARFAERLRSKGLRPVSLYTGGAFHVDREAAKTTARLIEAARICRDAGFSVIVCNPDPIGRDKSDAELQTQADALRDLGREITNLGLRLGIHHHTPEMRQGAREFHSNFQRTKAGEVDFCFDVHWVYRGGLPPLKALEQYHDRVVSWHLRQSRDQIWWEDLDTGDVDYTAIAAQVRKHHLPRRFAVELALEQGTRITRTVVENHRRSREFIRKVFGV
ncbi:MAG TPA: hypothetical protein DCM86_03645 [Verrucomicrobiales bacterium]|nr:hypothetical protein [Verrucomicrobiales bacterium]